MAPEATVQTGCPLPGCGGWPWGPQRRKVRASARCLTIQNVAADRLRLPEGSRSVGAYAGAGDSRANPCPAPRWQTRVFSWAPAAGVEELRARLSLITDRLRRAGDAALLEVVVAVVVYLAAHPERRRVEQAVIGEALREEYGDRVPDEVVDWLATQPSITPHPRHHGARPQQRHFRSRPLLQRKRVEADLDVKVEQAHISAPSRSSPLTGSRPFLTRRVSRQARTLTVGTALRCEWLISWFYG